MTKRQLPYIAKVTLPMFYLMIVALGLVYFIPELITWLPQRMKLGS
jgi:C4-dicarboxylate transporter DctM subunit